MTWYPDPHDIITGSPGNPDSNNPSDTGKYLNKRLQPQKNSNPGFVDTTQGNQNSEGINKDDLDVAMCSCPGHIFEKRQPVKTYLQKK